MTVGRALAKCELPRMFQDVLTCVVGGEVGLTGGPRRRKRIVEQEDASHRETKNMQTRSGSVK